MSHKSLFILILVLIPLITLNIKYSWADTGKFAILIFGGGYAGPGKSIPQDEEYVEYEIAPMFENLVDPNKYEFANNNIYVFNLSGDTIDSYYEHFNTAPNKYFKADSTDIIDKFQNLNSELNGCDQNLVYIFMSGHQGQGPSGDTNYYRLYDYDITDADFARWIENDLLDYIYNVKSKTRVSIIAGFCAPWKFVDPEIADVCTYFTYAVSEHVWPGSKSTDSRVSKALIRGSAKHR